LNESLEITKPYVFELSPNGRNRKSGLVQGIGDAQGMRVQRKELPRDPVVRVG